MRLLSCPECTSEMLIVLDSRGKGAYRRRYCQECGATFSTEERIVSLRSPIHHARIKGQIPLPIV